ncbi:hypothetical protein RHSIM_Rhsim01G0167900 [Rhododendron simsii]|uniref:BED-type domain-containing protein n=1 Tax=Rhododendron simsii TaxID=118357 RepID=A0A834LU08_RHOSS|nr:hypothetical protein RHSIM_Rhsim01G0167900 [Rhododendron simsii]
MAGSCNHAGHFLLEEDDKFLERVQAAVEEEERQTMATADKDAAKEAIATASPLQSSDAQPFLRIPQTSALSLLSNLRSSIFSPHRLPPPAPPSPPSSSSVKEKRSSDLHLFFIKIWELSAEIKRGNLVVADLQAECLDFVASELLFSLIREASVRKGRNRYQNRVTDISRFFDNAGEMSDHEHEMDDMDDDDIMDEGAEFDIPQNAELNDDLMPEINNETEKKVVGMKKRAPCWKHFTFITPENHPKPRAACNWCGTDYACHSKLNGTKSLTHHLAYQCTKYPLSKKFTGSRQKLLSFQRKENNGETSANLVPVAFSADACKRALARMIIIDELPFSFVEGEGFRDFITVVQPMWNPPRRLAMAKQIMVMYEDEKKTLKHTLKNQRVCLTTDTWTSVQNLNYMCLTGHFIDENWRYQKKILNFCVVHNHKGDTLGRKVEECLLDWGIDKFLTVTVDNASSNNLFIRYLERKTKDRKATILNHDFLHVRCSAHILNLIVREGLQEIDVPIARVRNMVRYVRSSPSRMAEFWSCVEKEKIVCRLKPCLDVSTRWNYTYFMLERALSYQKAFDRLCDDPSFKLNVREEEMDEDFDDVNSFEGINRVIEIEKRKKKRGGKGRKEYVGPPSSSDWEKIKLYVKFLRVFYVATLKFSGSLYVTCNVFFDEMVLIQQDIMKLCDNEDSDLYDLAMSMRTKFDKYWGDFNKINQMMMFAVVLDPRCKVAFFEYCLQNTLGYDKAIVGEFMDKLKSEITRLFGWYVKHNGYINVRNKEVGGSSDTVDLDGLETEIGNHKSLKSQFKMHKQKEGNMASKTELEKYLAETSEDDCDNFDVLRWWKLNSSKYPIVSQMARDVLAIPVSTVASESAFSTGGRVIDPYRSSLSPKTMEALICTQQWIRKPTKINIREQLDELEALDSGLTGTKLLLLVEGFKLLYGLLGTL